MNPTIKDYLTAGSPVLMLKTIEYELALSKTLGAVKEMMGKDSVITVGLWSITSGLREGKLRLGKDISYKLKDADLGILDALAWIEKLGDNDKSELPGILVLYNIRGFLEGDNQSTVAQALIEAAMEARKKECHIVIIGPGIPIIPELKNLIVFPEMKLPTFDELKAHFEEVIEDNKKTMCFPDGKPWVRYLGKGPEDLNYRAEEKDRLLTLAARAACGMSIFAAEQALSLSIAVTETIDPKIIINYKREEISSSDVLEFITPNDTLAHIGGFGALKTWLKHRERAFSEEARAYGLSYPKGILLVGPAGSGKSICSKAIGSFLGVPVIKVSVARMHRKWYGESEALMEDSLRLAEAIAPCVLWMDEIEKGFAGLSSESGGLTKRMLSILLTWRAETDAPVLIVATANEVEALPPELTRKGRFDEIWTTGLPTTEERRQIYTIHLKKRGRNPEEFDIDLLADKTQGYVGAEIEESINEAMYAAFFQNREIETRDILSAVKNTVPQYVREKEAITKILEWAEKRARHVSDSTEDEVENKTGKVTRMIKRERTDLNG